MPVRYLSIIKRYQKCINVILKKGQKLGQNNQGLGER